MFRIHPVVCVGCPARVAKVVTENLCLEHRSVVEARRGVAPVSPGRLPNGEHPRERFDRLAGAPSRPLQAGEREVPVVPVAVVGVRNRLDDLGPRSLSRGLVAHGLDPGRPLGQYALQQ